MAAEDDKVQHELDQDVQPFLAPPMETWVHDVGEWLRNRYKKFDAQQSVYFSKEITARKLHTIHQKQKGK